MKFQYFSDLHTEGHNNEMHRILPVEKLLKKEEGVVILAGDIMVFSNKINPSKMFDYLYKAGINPIYIPGNHEYYRSTSNYMVDSVMQYTRLIETPEAIFILTPLLSYLKEEIQEDVEMGVSDFRLVKEHSAKLHNELHEYCKSFIETNLSRFINDNRKKIVVTHFTPSYNSIHPKWYGSVLNTYFSNNLDEMILKYEPDVWIHGHTHDAFDYKIGKTRVLCNPLGYSFEYHATKKFHFNVIEI